MNFKGGSKDSEKLSRKPKYDVTSILKELSDTDTKSLFDLFQYLKDRFKEKTVELELFQACDRHRLERSKIRKTILKYISVFHPDKQCFESKEFGPIAEEITKQLNFHLKSY